MLCNFEVFASAEVTAETKDPVPWHWEDERPEDVSGSRWRRTVRTG